MTPTEQDKEFRELLYTLLKTDPRADTYVIPYRVMDIFVEFITADRKRLALEARIDELHIEADRFREAGHKGLPPNFQPRMNNLQRELKAQQEEMLSHEFDGESI